MNIMNPPPPAPETLPPIAPSAKARWYSRSIVSVLMPPAVRFFASHELLSSAAMWRISPRSSACFISTASRFS